MRVSILFALLSALASGCATSGAGGRSVTATPGIERVAAGGLAIAAPEALLAADVPAEPPVGAVGAEIHVNLALAVRETRVEPPEVVRTALAASGPGVAAWGRLVRAVARGERTAPGEFAAFAPVLDVDYVLLLWLREELESGTEPVSAEPGAADFPDFPVTGGLAPYREVVGALHGHVVELATGRTVWARPRAWPSRSRPPWPRLPSIDPRAGRC